MYPAVVTWLHSGPLPWLSYLVPRPGLLYAAVVLVCGALYVHRAVQSGFATEVALEVILAATLAALVGTRLFYLVTRTRFWEMSLPELVNASKGTASWGAYLGAALGMSAYALWRRLPPLQFVDIGTSVAGLGDAIGRVNCWLTGDDFGKVTTWAWGIRYPQGSLPWGSHLHRGLVQRTDQWSLPVHPNTLVLGAAALVVFLLTSWYWRGHRDRAGRTTALFCVLYGAERFVVEFLRDPDGGGASGALSHSQYMCLALICAGTALWWALAHRTPGHRRAPAT